MYVHTSRLALEVPSYAYPYIVTETMGIKFALSRLSDLLHGFEIMLYSW